MKKKNLKLQLNKETIAKLNNEELNEIRGGKTQTDFVPCCPTQGTCIVTRCVETSFINCQYC